MANTSSQRTPFSPAIFTPFTLPPSLPDSAPRPTAIERQRTILARVEAQQNAVRRNMLYLVGVEKDRIVQAAMEKCAEQEARGEVSDKKLDGLVDEKEFEGICERMRAPLPEGADVEAVLWLPGQLAYPPMQAKGLGAAGAMPVHIDGDTVMKGAGEGRRGGGGGSAGEERTRMSRNAQELFRWATDHMKAYDAHAAASTQQWEGLLARQVAREMGEPVMPASANPATSTSSLASAAGAGRRSGILTNRNDFVRIDREAMARIEADLEGDEDTKGT